MGTPGDKRDLQLELVLWPMSGCWACRTPAESTSSLRFRRQAESGWLSVYHPGASLGAVRMDNEKSFVVADIPG